MGPSAVTEPWMTVCEVEDRLIEAGLGRLVDTNNGFGGFVSDDVALGLSDKGFTVHVYDRRNLKRVKEVFKDVPQVVVVKTSKTKPFG